LAALKDFHGHLGPYVVVGWRMGRLAEERLGKGMKAAVRTGTDPPMSCIIDGIQVGSACTVGKGNLAIWNERRPEAIFRNESTRLEIRLLPHMWRAIEEEMASENEEELAERVYSRPTEELFHVIEKPA
jgi:formylmethanofuran dehydrogenase subunit E